MSAYNLEQDESLVLKCDRARYKGSDYSDELLLTDKGLVIIDKGIFGKIKSIIRIPINDIKVYNGRAQAILGTDKSHCPQLEIYFINGQEIIGFESKKEVNKWIHSINQLVTKRPKTKPSDSNIIKDTLGAIKGTLGAKEKNVTLIYKCIECGAPIQGTKGQITRCEYCGKDQQL